MALSDIIAAVEHGAALVYHEIVAVESDVTQWSANNPEVAPLLKAGIEYAVKMLVGVGLPVPEIVVAGTAVLAVLKALAAADPTVQSGGTRAAGRAA